MQIGVVYPQVELGGDPVAVRRVGKAVEDLGFDYLLAYDHVLGAVHADRTPQLPGPYTELDPFHDPFVMFGYLAGITERIGLATGVLVLPQRQTALVARQVADVDLLSGGRLRLGVAWAGTTSSTKPSDRTSALAVHGKRNRSNYFGDCSSNPSSTSRDASTEWTVPHWYRSQRGPSRSGSEVLARRRSTGRPAWRTVLYSLVPGASRGLWMPGSRCVGV